MGPYIAWIALGLTTLIQCVSALDGWRQRRERQEVKAESADEQLGARVRRLEVDIAELRQRDLADLRREVARRDDLARVEGRVDEIFTALRRNGHAT